MFIGFFGVVYMTWLYATWLPGYLETQRHLSIAAAGAWSAVPLGAGFLGAVAGGFISDTLGKRGIDAAAACRIPIICGAARRRHLYRRRSPGHRHPQPPSPAWPADCSPPMSPPAAAGHWPP